MCQAAREMLANACSPFCLGWIPVMFSSPRSLTGKKPILLISHVLRCDNYRCVPRKLPSVCVALMLDLTTLTEQTTSFSHKIPFTMEAIFYTPFCHFDTPRTTQSASLPAHPYGLPPCPVLTPRAGPYSRRGETTALSTRTGATT